MNHFPNQMGPPLRPPNYRMPPPPQPPGQHPAPANPGFMPPQNMHSNQFMMNQQHHYMGSNGDSNQDYGSANQPTADKTMRSIFVGNIPYEATEEKLIELFSNAGPVLSFRLVFDRESGKAKGYGFCEYSDVTVANSALRNLQNIEFNGRPLRIGPAAGDQNNVESGMFLNPNNISMTNINTVAVPNVVGAASIQLHDTSPYGEPMNPKDSPEAISKAVASLPPEQMFDLMLQMKHCVQRNPIEARTLLLQNPQLAYALLQAQIVMKIVDPKLAIAMLSRTNEQFPPLNASPSSHQASTRTNPVPVYTNPTPQPVPSSVTIKTQPTVTQTYTQRANPPANPQNLNYNQSPVGFSGSAVPSSAPIRPTSSSTASVPVTNPTPVSQPGPEDQAKTALVMKVLELSDQQIAMLPEDQRRSILILREQIAAGGSIS